MISYTKISSRLIKPHNLYTYDPSVKQYFYGRFGNDEKSFNFLHHLIRWCCERNQGEWPDKITPQILSSMSKDGCHSITVEEMKIFEDGYILKDGVGNYELTHEFIVSAFMCCSDGNFLPLQTGHIDFNSEEKIAAFLRDHMVIKEPQAVTFLTKLALDNGKTSGMLMDREVSLRRVMQIARENDLIFDLCIDWAQGSNMLSVQVEENTVICNALMLSVYAVSPRLN